MIDAAKPEQLTTTLRGRVIERGDDDYANACKL